MTARRIPILFVIENERYGGGERAFAQLINGLDKTEYEVYAACLTGALDPAAAAFTGQIGGAAKVFCLDLRRLVSPSAFFALKEIIRGNGIGLIHSQGARADFYARLAARAAGGVPVVSTIASPVEEYDVNFFKKAVYRALDRLGTSSVSRFIAVADHIKRKLVAGRGIPEAKVARIYNGVDAAEFLCRPELAGKARAAYGIAPDCFLAAAFCRLSPEKGLFTLVEAAKHIAESGAAAPGAIKYLIAGAGPLEPDLKAAVRELGLEDSFIFTGFVADVRPLLCAADLLALPSFREGFPVSVLEAMAMGKPVIGSDVEGIDESVTGGATGLLVPAGNGAALAGAVLDLYRDRARAAAMGARGRELVAEKFSLEKMVGAHEALYAAAAFRTGDRVPAGGTR